jgi:hypothetical protein
MSVQVNPCALSAAMTSGGVGTTGVSASFFQWFFFFIGIGGFWVSDGGLGILGRALDGGSNRKMCSGEFPHNLLRTLSAVEQTWGK